MLVFRGLYTHLVDTTLDNNGVLSFSQTVQFNTVVNTFLRIYV